MNKKLITLTESELHNIVEDVVSNVMNGLGLNGQQQQGQQQQTQPQQPQQQTQPQQQQRQQTQQQQGQEQNNQMTSYQQALTNYLNNMQKYNSQQFTAISKKLDYCFEMLKRLTNY